MKKKIELQTACRGYSANRRVFGNLHERQSDRRGGRGVLKEHPNAAGRFEVIPTAKKKTPKRRKLAGNRRNSKRHTTVSPSSNPRKRNLKAVAPHCRPESTPRRPPKRRPPTTKPGSGDTGAESADEADEQPAGYNGNTADDAIRQAIAAELVAGKSKTAIKQELAGKEIGGVKLTHRLISDYIEKITAEE